MQPGPANILTCPHCGGKKEVMSLMSGNTCRATVWTDTRRDYPMLPQVSPIQRCPECGKYYFLDQCESKYDEDINSWSMELGKLNYGDLRLAYAQLSKENLTDLQRWALNHEFFMSYNDCYRRYPETVAFPPSDEEKEMFMSIIGDLLQNIDSSADYELFHSELLRESRRFDEAKAVLVQHKSPDDQWIVKKLVRLCDRHDDMPHLLIKDGEIID